MTQHGERHTPTGATFAIDGDGALVDAGDGSDLVLQIFVGERDLVAATEVLWAWLVNRCLAD